MAINKDGSYGSRATNKELAECYGVDVAVNMLATIHEVHPSRLEWYLDTIKQQATIAGHYGRKSLRQSKLR